MIELEKLDAGLAKLSGYDLEAVEAQERAAGNTNVVIDSSKSFLGRLAARALGVPVDDLKKESLSEYNAACLRVMNFLFRSGSNQPEQSEELVSN